MANQFFKNFPEIQYTLKTGKIITIKDFFRKSSVEQDAVNDLVDYSYYELLDGERPDVVASKLYGDGDLHWTFFLVNDFTNYYDWFMDNATFEAYLDEKYQGQVLNATVSSDIVSAAGKFLIGEVVTSNLDSKTATVLMVEPTHNRIVTLGDTFGNGETISNAGGKSFRIDSVSEYRDAVHHFENADKVKRNFGGSGWTEIPLYRVEMDENEKKRKIKIIKPSKIKRVVSEFESVMSNG
jgi:hypothetical protein